MVATIRVDDDVYRELEGQARGFGDTPNMVLRRLLGLDRPAVRVAEAAVEYRPRLTGFRRGRPPLTERRTTSQAAMRRALLEAVAEAGGEAATAEVRRRSVESWPMRFCRPTTTSCPTASSVGG